MRVRIEEIVITPDMAAAMLATSAGNRHIREEQVAAYARDMLSGRWFMTGDTIGFNADGRLVDGHHRLEAVVASGVSLHTFAVYGIGDEAHGAIDTGIKRTQADEFGYRGEVNKHLLAAIVSNVWRYDLPGGPVTSSVPTRAELHYVLEQNPGIRSFTSLATSSFGSITTGPLGAVAYIAAREVEVEEAENWLGRLKSDTGFEEGDPCLALRRYAASVKKRRIALSRIDWMAICIKSFNAYLAGTSVRNLSWRRGGKYPEKFPRIVNPYAVDDHVEEGVTEDAIAISGRA